MFEKLPQMFNLVKYFLIFNIQKRNKVSNFFFFLISFINKNLEKKTDRNNFLFLLINTNKQRKKIQQALKEFKVIFIFKINLKF